MFTWLAIDFVAVVSFTAGGYAVWKYKPQMQAWVIGVNAVSAKMHAEADALLAKASAVKAAVK